MLQMLLTTPETAYCTQFGIYMVSHTQLHPHQLGNNFRLKEYIYVVCSSKPINTKFHPVKSIVSPTRHQKPQI